jgi:hypothetical protein
MTTKITSANITQSGTSGISSVSWQAVQTTGFTAVAGNAYPCDTTSAAFTVTLPASPAAGNVITLTDYAGTFGTNNLTINPNGLKIQGETANKIISKSNNSVNLVYIDSTRGWLVDGAVTFSPFNPPPSTVEYLVVAGGGGGGNGSNVVHGSGGGGAGGYRSNVTGESSGGGASAEAIFNVTPSTSYTVTVGAGGASNSIGTSSVFSTITSIYGGAGGGTAQASNGGSGGGAKTNTSSNTVGLGTANQGYSGGSNTTASPFRGGGGGGAGAVGTNGSSQATAGNGGIGVVSSITGTSLTRGGGGGGGASLSASAGTGGSGGGGNGSGSGVGSPGSSNTGGGGGGGYEGSNGAGGNGGSGVVIIAYPNTFANLASIGVGLTYTLDTTTRSGYKVYTFTAGTGTISW